MLEQACSSITSTVEPVYVYARQGKPNGLALEKVLTHAEKGIGAVVFGSGMAAIYAASLSSHPNLTAGKHQKFGIKVGCIRPSISIKDVNDIFHDLDQVLLRE